MRLVHLLPCLALIAAPAYSAVVFTDGLVGYFDFSSDTTNKAAAAGSNVSGTFVNGTLANASVTATAIAGAPGGYQGNGLNLTPTTTASSSMNVGIGYGAAVSSTANLGQNFTISAWFNFDSAPVANGTSRYFVWEGQTDFDASLGLRNDLAAGGNYDIQFFYNNNATRNVNDGAPGNTWINAIQTFEVSGLNTNITSYINGVAVGATVTVTTASITDSGINFGRARNGTNTRGFDGSIDEIGLWNRVLNPEEIAGLAAGTLIPEPSTTALLGLASLALFRRRRA